jgi:hypothetical protein
LDDHDDGPLLTRACETLDHDGCSGVVVHYMVVLDGELKLPCECSCHPPWERHAAAPRPSSTTVTHPQPPAAPVDLDALLAELDGTPWPQLSPEEEQRRLRARHEQFSRELRENPDSEWSQQMLGEAHAMRDDLES